MQLRNLFSRQSFNKIRLIVRTFPPKKKVFFIILLTIFVISALGLLLSINGLLSKKVADYGGTIKEGIIGTPRFINPILEISDADRDLTALIYSGLMRSDGDKGLLLDLAENYEASDDGLTYTFTIKENARFHDNTPVTSDDVIFTINQIKDPSLKSPKRASWEGIGVEKIDERSFMFLLKQPYAPFLENTTMGILPKHIWEEAIGQISFSDFNIKPIGSGPYKIDKITRNSSGISTSYTLTANKNFTLKRPFIKKLIIKFYANEEKLVQAFQGGEIDNIGGISPSLIEDLKGKFSVKILNLPRVFALFFNQNNAAIFAKKEVREALNVAVNKDKIIEEVLRGFGIKIDSPIPPGTFGAADAIFDVEKETSNIDRAKEILTANGWELNEEDNIFEKIVKKEVSRLEFSLSTSNVPDLKQTAELLKSMWEEMGAKVNLKIFETGDLNQNVIRPRKYDTLLFGEILGRDPDPFAFWHSSQRNDPGLNIAGYANIAVDKLIEEARQTKDKKEREEKYLKFQEELLSDIPAVFLYSPSYIYLTTNKLKGINTKNISLPSERFSNVYDWHVKTKNVLKIFTD